MKFIILILFILINHIIFSQEVQDTLPDYPIATKIPYYFINHGDSVLQNYNWMRVKHTPEIINYLEAENTYTDVKMKPTSILQKKIFEEMRSVMNENHSSRTNRIDNYYYYSRTEEGKEHSIQCRKKDSLTAKEEIILDPNLLAKDLGYFTLAGMNLSVDHSLLVYSVNTEGGDYGSIYFKNLEKDSTSKEFISRVGSFLILPDNKTVYYIKNDPITKRFNQLFTHVIGTDTLMDQLVFQITDPKFSFGISLSTSKRFLIIASSTFGMSGEAYIIDLSGEDRSLRKLISPEKGITTAIDHYEGDNFVVYTNKNAPDYLVKEVDILTLKNEKIIFPEEKGAKIESLLIKGNYYIVQRFKNALNELLIVNRTTGKRVQINGPESIGVISLGNELKYDSTSIEYSFSSLITPTIIYKYDLINDISAAIWRDTVKNYNSNLYKTERVWAKSRDGKQIPIDLVYKKELKRDSKNPTYITGYGCYGMNETPDFNRSFLPYLNRNFICAIAHPRGESIMGEQWHTDGMLMKKINTINDFVDCTQSLIDSAYTSPKKIVAQGGSAGGLLMGGVANVKPELYSAIIADVPFVNTLEDMLDTLWPGIIPHFLEIGNPYVKKEYDYIKSYSPLHNIERKDYPTMLVTNGYNDSRVPYWAAAQYVARLRDMKTDTNRLFLKTTMEGGHSGASGRYSQIKSNAFKIAFALTSLGIKEDYLAVSGKLVDEKGESIPYANVFVEGSANGTVTNFDGDFYLEIKEGQKLKLIFQAFEYKKQTYAIDSKSKVKDIRIVMVSQIKELEEVVVTAKAKDRGNEIIKKANDQMEHFDKMLDNYSVNVYVKGVQRLDSIPKKLPKFIKISDLPDSNDLGLLYLTESVAAYNFQKPDNYKEEMISSKVAGRKQGMSNNRVSEVNFNFYQNSFLISGEKPFISPIADGGIMLYKYNLISSVYEDGNRVFKIKVTPRNKAEAVFGGYIYINDKTWSIHSVDLFVTKASGIEFIDSVYIKQTYQIINDSISAPRSITMNSRFKFFGFNGGFVNVGSFYNYQFNKKFPKKFFQKQVFSIASDAVKKDTTYWTDNRPVVLTKEENKFYTKKDTVVEKDLRMLDTIPDSIMRLRNKVTLGKLFVFGYRYNGGKHILKLDPLLGDLGYNTVEGLKTEIGFTLTKKLSNNQEWYQRNGYYFSSRWRYGIASEKLYAKFSFGNNNSGEQRYWNVSIGNYIYQYNRSEPIIDYVNAAYTLLLRQNFAKLYEKTSVSYHYSDLLKWGPKIDLGIEYAQRKALKNHEKGFLIPQAKDQTTSNNPMNLLSDSLAFKTHNALILNFSGSYTPGEKFEMVYNFRRVIGSHYPTLYWDFEQGIKGLGSAVGFGRYQIGVGKSLKFGYWGKSNIDIIVGGFVNKSSSYFMDYKHFNGNETHILKNGTGNWQGRDQLDQFNALSYYGFSTNDNYLEFHFQHRFLGLFLTKIPLLNKLHLQEVTGINAVYTSGNRNYQEIYVGVENIAKIIRIDFVASYKAYDVIRPMIRIGIKRPI